LCCQRATLALFHGSITAKPQSVLVRWRRLSARQAELFGRFRSVWVAWHLVPVALKIGMFRRLEAAPPLMFAAFIASFVVNRRRGNKADAQVTVHYTLPMPPDKVPVEGRDGSELGRDGGAERPIFRTYSVTFPLAA